MRIVVYTRVSTEDQARSGYSLQEQQRACRARAAELGVAGSGGRETNTPPVPAEFQDEMSGEILERPGLQAALDLLRREPVQYFVCLDPDRLARRLMHQLLITDQIESAGCRLEFVQHDYQDTPEGRLFYQLRGAIAEFEKAKILERTMRGARGKVAAGGLPHVIRLYGYAFRKGAGKAAAREVLVPDQREAEWVRAMFRWCGLERLGPRRIAERLCSLGVATKTGRGAWGGVQVQRILRHPVYATGRLALGKQDHRGIQAARRLPAAERRRQGLTLTARPKPDNTWSYVEVEPVVEPELWRQAQAVLDSFRTGGRARGRGPARLLTGLGRCGLCGGPLYYLNGNRVVCANRYARHWSATARGRDRTCSLPAKRREAVEAAVWAAVRGWLDDPELLVQEAAALAAAEQTNGCTGTTGSAAAARVETEVVLLQRQTADKQAEAERLGVLFVRGLWPAEQALAALTATNRELAALQARMAVLQDAAAEAAVATAGPLTRLLAQPDWPVAVRQTLDTLAPEQRAALVRLLVHAYTLHPTPRGQTPAVTVTPAFAPPATE